VNVSIIIALISIQILQNLQVEAEVTKEVKVIHAIPQTIVKKITIVTSMYAIMAMRAILAAAIETVIQEVEMEIVNIMFVSMMISMIIIIQALEMLETIVCLTSIVRKILIV